MTRPPATLSVSQAAGLAAAAMRGALESAAMLTGTTDTLVGRLELTLRGLAGAQGCAALRPEVAQLLAVTAAERVLRQQGIPSGLASMIVGSYERGLRTLAEAAVRPPRRARRLRMDARRRGRVRGCG
ncbi:hypothetical protein LO762_07835 [Actinocorallia sp. API 0066]|uniref:hypothetical protein n=1 Tax=Actinocorallia sp. API 0066 TaxID=2896846 RepID=UPI001E4843C0|nr:hypothetical protein [Actinocorallia sp. API 0066]MCD0449099.1 hypothetical protein [Actinocorallia sp. API 0066]